jgi:hypothetical protein
VRVQHLVSASIVKHVRGVDPDFRELPCGIHRPAPGLVWECGAKKAAGVDRLRSAIIKLMVHRLVPDGDAIASFNRIRLLSGLPLMSCAHHVNVA